MGKVLFIFAGLVENLVLFVVRINVFVDVFICEEDIICGVRSVLFLLEVSTSIPALEMPTTRSGKVTGVKCDVKGCTLATRTQGLCRKHDIPECFSAGCKGLLEDAMAIALDILCDVVLIICIVRSAVNILACNFCECIISEL